MSTVSRRGFLKAAGVLGAGAAWPRRVRAQGGKGKVRFAYLQLGWAACEIIHKEDLLGKRGWQAEYNVVPGSPAGLVNTFAAGQVDAIDMSFALSAKMFEDKVPLRVTGVATAVLGAIVARKDVRDHEGRGPQGPEDRRGGRHHHVLRHPHADAEGLRLRHPEGHPARHRARRRPTWRP